MVRAPQKVVVTAAAGGAGRTIARRFHADGARVFACDIDQAGLGSLARELAGVAVAEMDAGEPASVVAACRTAVQTLGGVDVLVNAIGIAGVTAAVEDIALADWNEVMRVNLTSQFLFAQGVIPSMKSARDGLIVNISSQSAKIGLPLRLPYVVSKGAVISLTMNLARELGPFGIRVNAILPGPMRGARLTRVIRDKARALGVSEADYEASLVRHTSLRTLTEPEDVAAAIAYLASDGGRRVSGQCISVDANLEWEA